ncbi:MarR family transcriptional regulator [Streptomyces sp. Ru73]|uniref:MarR family winged helix-turn-helix transcriptional regulator n=1 Tax=Streptomyces sp. Ru73 TaxID=2080748 RepID=UPI000CDD8DE7|nr:MarR family transcriptional regulator [Streptomyces sp. Ru73]POX38265.1 MarR family transcriptional regulator [Streptomyces sp. Ru73]
MDDDVRAREDSAAEEAAAARLGEAAAGLGSEIVRFSRLVTAWRRHAKTDAGAADRVLLAKLVNHGDRRATDLAADALLDLSTVSRQVRSLVERGLVERYPDPEDRRGTLLRATEAGHAAFGEYRRQRDTKLAALLEPWPEEDRAHLVRLMGRLNDDLEQARHARPAHPAPESGETAVKEKDAAA